MLEDESDVLATAAQPSSYGPSVDFSHPSGAHQLLSTVYRHSL